MKLLFAIKNFTDAVGGAEKVLCVISSLLVERGHDVTVLSFDSAGGKSFYPIDERVKQIRLPVGDATKPADFFVSIKRMFQLRRHVKELKPDVTIGFMHSIFIPLAFSLVGTGFPVVASEHIVPQHYKTRPFQFLLFAISSLLIKKITVLSSAVKDMYPFFIQNKMIPLSNPLLLKNITTESRVDNNQKIILNVGRLDLQKDQKTLIKAFAKVAKQHPEWRLKIIGEGELRPELEHLVQDLGLQERIDLPGVTSEIDQEYQKATIFVMSSLYESFGLVTAEAMSHGLPVIGFADCPGTNELIKHNHTGYLIDTASDRVISLATAMSNLMADAKKQQEFGTNGLNDIKNKFAPEKICSLWEDMLESVAAKGA